MAAELIVCAFLVLSGSRVGRRVGIIVGAIGCVSAVSWMPTTHMVPDLHCPRRALVIYALAAYEGNAEAA